MQTSVLLLCASIAVAHATDLNLTHVYRERCPLVTGASAEQRLAFHENMMYLLSQAANPTGPENLKAMLSRQFQAQFDAEYGTNGHECYTIGHECSWRSPHPRGGVGQWMELDGTYQWVGHGIYQCVYGPDWCALLNEEGAERCNKEPECFWSLPNPFYETGDAACTYHKEPGANPSGKSMQEQDPWWDRSKVPTVDCINDIQCRLVQADREMNAAATLERMNSPSVLDTYTRATRTSLGWLHAYDLASKGAEETSRYVAGVEQLQPPGVCKR